MAVIRKETAGRKTVRRRWSGLAVAAIVGIVMNAILPGKDYEFGVNEAGDNAVNFGTSAYKDDKK